MKLGTLYWILTLFSLVIFPGTASAHPHELGNIDHGQSLESYQIELDFTTDDLTKDRHNLDITLAKKDSIANSIKVSQLSNYRR